MLKKKITYKDYNDRTVVEDFYFNLTKAELVELQLSEKDGFSEALAKIVKSEDGKMIVEHFKKIILLSYGEKSEDGRRFKKTVELREEFSQTEAYSNLFVDLATDANAAAAFINGIVPAGMIEESKAAIQNVELPTAAPILEDTTQEDTSAAQYAQIPTDSPDLNFRVDPERRYIQDYTRLELLDMPLDEFNKLVENGIR